MTLSFVFRFQQMTSVTSPIYDQPISSSSLNQPWSGPYPSHVTTPRSRSATLDSIYDQTGPMYQGYLRGMNAVPRVMDNSANVVQSGVTFWSSQGNLDRVSVSPPPMPTADFPQYHPPSFLEPSDWAKTITNEDILHGSPAMAAHGPPAMVVHGPPAMHSLVNPSQRAPSRETSPRRVDVYDCSRPVSMFSQIFGRYIKMCIWRRICYCYD